MRGRGPPGRVRRLRGRHPRGQLRRRRGHRLGPGALDAARGSRRQGSRRASCSSSCAATSCAAVWTLVRTKTQGQDRGQGVAADQEARRVRRAGPEADYPQESILSGLHGRGAGCGRRAARPRCARSSRGSGRRGARCDVGDVRLMLAETRERPFSRPGWIFELKYDGYRVLAGREDGKPALRLPQRQRRDRRRFPEIAARGRGAALRRASSSTARSWSSTPRARPSFGLLQQRALLTAPAGHRRGPPSSCRPRSSSSTCSPSRASTCAPCRSLARKELLRQLLPRAGPLRFADHVEERGDELLAEVPRELGLEGMVAKKADSPYRGGALRRLAQDAARPDGRLRRRRLTRSRKARAPASARCTSPRAQDGGLVYAGRVGTRLRREAARRRSRAPLEETACGARLRRARSRRGAGTSGSSPSSSSRCGSRSGRPTGLLRQPVFLRLRDDKPLEECVREDDPARRRAGSRVARTRTPPRARPDRARGEDRSLHQPRQGLLARRGLHQGRPHRLLPRDLAVAPALPEGPAAGAHPLPRRHRGQIVLPEGRPGLRARLDAHRAHLERARGARDRLLRLRRRRDAPLRRQPRHDPAARLVEPRRDARAPRLVHPRPRSRRARRSPHVVEIARAIHALCDEIGLPTFVKTSGATGLHVLVPLGGQCTYEQSRTLGELLARAIEQDHGKIATTARTLGARGGKVYVDYPPERPRQAIAGPFSARPVPGAPARRRSDGARSTRGSIRRTTRSRPFRRA